MKTSKLKKAGIVLMSYIYALFLFLAIDIIIFPSVCYPHSRHYAYYGIVEILLMLFLGTLHTIVMKSKKSLYHYLFVVTVAVTVIAFELLAIKI